MLLAELDMGIESNTWALVQPVPDTVFASAADALLRSRTLIITSGAGMGVDSGLPSFRDANGFWNAYPAYQKLGVNFMDIATPRHMTDDPTFGWGFYGSRANQYRDAVPHEGFALLKDWIERFALEWFVVTSNVDGQFQKAGFDEERVEEVHGSIHYLQCHKPCRPEIWRHNEVFEIDADTMRAKHTPTCIHCGELARPNILMFNDWWYIPVRSNAQNRRYKAFIDNCPKPIAVVEIGAGRAIPTIRYISETIARQHGAMVIRINPRESQITEPHVSIAMDGVSALKRIDALL